MVRKVRLRRMGGSIGATLPKDITERLHLDVGDEIFVVETEGGVLLTPFDPTFDEAMAAYKRGAKKYRNTLRELAQ
jgi:putative addiction module antidote